MTDKTLCIQWQIKKKLYINYFGNYVTNIDFLHSFRRMMGNLIPFFLSFKI